MDRNERAHRFVQGLALALEHLAQRKIILVVVGVQLKCLADREEERLLGLAPFVYHFLFDHTRICAVRYDDPIPSHRLLADEVEEGFCGGSMASEVALRHPSSRRHSPSCTFLTENCHSWYGMMSSSESGFRSMAITAPRGTASRYSQ